ncbi:nucleoside-diphosphate sugar epimerase/dehydratase [Butyrivibrio sp. NC2007]|uniref:nucleoside-diphosphate sugar epimerase/dehydratase n=1 Tax=Butyrivibrio sp. NC2007 TaxID=1280683 RepID=UPI0012DD004D|nr:hypothetical protein [Butyrivibrio sp. NC2007]
MVISDTAIEKIMCMDKIVIYGAGVMGKALKLCLESKPFNKRIQCFIVSNRLSNPKMIKGTPVIGMEEAEEYKDDTIIVALNENNMPGAIEGLHKQGFKKLLIMNAASDEWSHIKKCYFLNNQDKCYIPFKMLPEGI